MMSDMGDMYRDMREHRKQRRHARLDAFDPEGWNRFTDYHFWKKLKKGRLEYWPSTRTYRYNGKTQRRPWEYIAKIIENDS